jgi:ABC-2 type transport system permease protein
MNLHVIFAIFRRNFTGYFSSPIGYVFICAFVLMSGFAAFWPNEFFNANLATLDQLNKHLPWIMLVFIPAITMSIWADERRQGTDELVLTLPCTDLDVVIGKYLAALAIYTVALAFSFSNILVLRFVGNPDVGVLISNYAGYWLVGAAMLSIGMVASFLTNSLTVAFILALAFNAPLVFAYWADSILPWAPAARFIKSASIAEQFADYGKGLITLSGLLFFASIICISLYVSMVLIGRRHWAGGSYGTKLGGHFAVRAAALVAIAIGVNALGARYGGRLDMSAERVNSLSKETVAMLKSLDTLRPVFVEAYVSPSVPEEYVQTRLNLLSMLRAAHTIGGDKVLVQIHETPRYSDNEAQAEQLYGIRPQPVQSTTGGKFAMEEIILGVAFTCGLDKVVVPFFDRGVPIEYEIMRSIATVSQQKRKKIGVLTTDAKMYGGFDVETFSQRPNQLMIEELSKQYDVVQVNAELPITERYDALLAVQPSSMTAEAINNFVAAVKAGQPTAIFEDPMPFLDASVAATSQPRQPPRRNPFMQQQPPPPKGDIKPLWDALGVRFMDREVIWQDYNPYPKIEDFSKAREFVFIGYGQDRQPGATEPFNQQHPITRGLQQVVALFAGSVTRLPGSSTTFTPLIQTGRQTGVVAFDEIIQRNFLGQGGLNPNRRQRPTNEPFILAAHITGTSPAAPAAATAPDSQNPAAGSNINVVLVSDIDMLYSQFFAIRARGTDKNDPVVFRFDNVPFVLNTLDYLAGDHRFIEMRKRQPAYRTLTTVEKRTEAARSKAADERRRFMDQFEAKQAEEQKRFEDRIAELNKREGLDVQQALTEVAVAQKTWQNRLNQEVDKLKKQRDREIEKIERRLAMEVRSVQDKYKLGAILFPPIPPLLVGAFVFKRRRDMERIGVPKARMRQ